MTAKNPPIIVIKKVSGHGGHHGGAWKVAYADFVTALMALFIVLWLMGQSQKVKQAVAGYFNDPRGTANLLGTTMTSNGAQVMHENPNHKRLEQLKAKLESEIQAKVELRKLANQIEITITPEGLRIELIEGKNGTFYQNGSARLSDKGQELLKLLAAELKTLPNDLLIEGYTDAAPYSKSADYTNWELSADRANAARRILQENGVRQNQVTQVRGYADQMLRDPANPFDPSNRRVTILVRNTPNGAVPRVALGSGLQLDPTSDAGQRAGGASTKPNPAAPLKPSRAQSGPAQSGPAQSGSSQSGLAKPATPNPAVLASKSDFPAALTAGKPSSLSAARHGIADKLLDFLPGKKK